MAVSLETKTTKDIGYPFLYVSLTLCIYKYKKIITVHNLYLDTGDIKGCRYKPSFLKYAQVEGKNYLKIEIDRLWIRGLHLSSLSNAFCSASLGSLCRWWIINTWLEVMEVLTILLSNVTIIYNNVGTGFLMCSHSIFFLKC